MLLLGSVGSSQSELVGPRRWPSMAWWGGHVVHVAYNDCGEGAL